MKLAGVCGTRTWFESHLSFDLISKKVPAALNWCVGCHCLMLEDIIYLGNI